MIFSILGHHRAKSSITVLFDLNVHISCAFMSPFVKYYARFKTKPLFKKIWNNISQRFLSRGYCDVDVIELRVSRRIRKEITLNRMKFIRDFLTTRCVINTVLQDSEVEFILSCPVIRQQSDEDTWHL